MSALVDTFFGLVAAHGDRLVIQAVAVAFNGAEAVLEPFAVVARSAVADGLQKFLLLLDIHVRRILLAVIFPNAIVFQVGEVWNSVEQENVRRGFRSINALGVFAGDHLVEQAIHNVDLTAWAMKDEMPVKCIAHGGRQIRPENMIGHIYDHFAVVYEWANGVKGFVNCRHEVC